MLNRKRTFPFVAIALAPVLICLLIGKGASLPEYILSGVTSIPQTGVMFIFSVAFFGIISETAEALGAHSVDIALAPMIGQMTTGWPVSPMVGTFSSSQDSWSLTSAPGRNTASSTLFWSPLP